MLFAISSNNLSTTKISGGEAPMEQLIDHIVTAQTIGDIREANETKPSISGVVSLNEVVLSSSM